MPRILDGTLHLFFAFDVGQGVDLDRCRERLAGEKAHPSALAFRFDPEPVRIEIGIAPLDLAGRASAPKVDALVHDFGAISLAYAVPFAGEIEECALLSAEASGVEGFGADARLRAQALLDRMGDAVRQPALAPIMEDYLVFAIRSLDGVSGPAQLLERHAPTLARILRGERQQLSEDEVQDALSARIAYGPEDLTLIDWNAALVLERESTETLAVLEYANVQLLEVRYLDGQLDRSLDRAYEAVARGRPGRRLDYRKVGRMQVEGAVLFERVNNALKLVGDQYLARLYRVSARRFHLATWNESIVRKLETIDSIYEKLFHRASTLRMEILEWLIILLIAFSIVLPFLT